MVLRADLRPAGTAEPYNCLGLFRMPAREHLPISSPAFEPNLQSDRLLGLTAPPPLLAATSGW